MDQIQVVHIGADYWLKYTYQAAELQEQSSHVILHSQNPAKFTNGFQEKIQPSGPSLHQLSQSRVTVLSINLFMLPLFFTAAATATKSQNNISSDHSQALSLTTQMPSNPRAAGQPLTAFKATDSRSIHSRCYSGLLAA